jgi:hypothetical protein
LTGKDQKAFDALESAPRLVQRKAARIPTLKVKGKDDWSVIHDE